MTERVDGSTTTRHRTASRSFTRGVEGTPITSWRRRHVSHGVWLEHAATGNHCSKRGWWAITWITMTGRQCQAKPIARSVIGANTLWTDTIYCTPTFIERSFCEDRQSLVFAKFHTTNKFLWYGCHNQFRCGYCLVTKISYRKPDYHL